MISWGNDQREDRNSGRPQDERPPGGGTWDRFANGGSRGRGKGAASRQAVACARRLRCGSTPPAGRAGIFASGRAPVVPARLRAIRRAPAGGARSRRP
ncbi:hypothetical protein G6F32_017237 [Rhizopus arrhizus]|nr:hypothetical protein G6F32_017237 [Rhizopus arrhizus]